MIKRLLILCIVSLVASCTLDVYHEPEGPYVPISYPEQEEVEYTYVEVTYYDDPLCYDDPYWHSPDWCDSYSDGTVCCVWYANGWYEEYCQWGDDYCWEYNGSF